MDEKTEIIEENEQNEQENTSPADDEMSEGEGMWLVLSTILGPTMKCSACGCTIRSPLETLIHNLHVYKYCFNCGAKMRMYEV